jgi:toxin YoeB
MKKVFADQAWEDYLYWKIQDRNIIKRINALVKDAELSPYEGIGKPEALKHSLAGYWSRRINDEHRMVYKVENDSLLLAQLRYHYEQ